MKVITLFSGVGMQEKAVGKVYDYELINFCEKDKKISKCFELIHNEPSSKNLGDITKIDMATYHKDLIEKGNDNIDLLISSFPCQSFSIAGKKAGFECSKNGNLFDKSFEMIQLIRPKMVIFENVKNITSKKFNAIEKIGSLMASIGYKTNHKILNGIEFNIPQNRERWFMICVLDENKNISFPSPVPLDRTIKDYLDTSITERKTNKKLIPYYTNSKKEYKSLKGLIKVFDGCSEFPDIFKSGFTLNRIYSIDGCAPTFTTSNDTHFYEIKGRLTTKERWRLMGLDDNDYDILKQNKISDGLIDKICGNGIIVNVFEALIRNLI